MFRFLSMFLPSYNWHYSCTELVTKTMPTAHLSDPIRGHKLFLVNSPLVFYVFVYYSLKGGEGGGGAAHDKEENICEMKIITQTQTGKE